MRQCGLTVIFPDSFTGLEDSLVLLDLSGNNLTITTDTIQNLELLETLNIRDNAMSKFNAKSVLSGVQHTLRKLDINGADETLTIQDLRRLHFEFK